MAGPEQALRALIAASIVRKHGGILYARDSAGGTDYLLVLPLPECEAVRPAKARESVGGRFLDGRTDDDGTAGNDAGAQAAAFD